MNKTIRERIINILKRKLRRVFINKDIMVKPKEVLIEVTNVCNLKCPMCHTYRSSRPRGYMDISLYNRVIDQVVDLDIRDVHLYTVGEPLLHKGIVDMVKIAKSNKRKVFIYTNGNLLDNDIARNLIDAELDNLVISLEGMDNSKYASIRRGGNFERAKDNISYAKKYRDSILGRTKIEIWSTIMDEDSVYLNSFKNYWRNYADRIFFVHLANQGGYIKGITGKTIDPKLRQPCGTLWNSIIVLWNGQVSACCVDFDGKMIMGNVYQTTLKEIWNGKKYLKYRKLHLEGKFHELSPCDVCDAGLVNINQQLKKLNEELVNIIPRTLRIND